jgi:hypothetical protein
MRDHKSKVESPYSTTEAGTELLFLLTFNSHLSTNGTPNGRQGTKITEPLVQKNPPRRHHSGVKRKTN